MLQRGSFSSQAMKQKRIACCVNEKEAETPNERRRIKQVSLMKHLSRKQATDRVNLKEEKEEKSVKHENK
jgi:hypothetical protein